MSSRQGLMRWLNPQQQYQVPRTDKVKFLICLKQIIP
jgi:hypothetical protein